MNDRELTPEEVEQLKQDPYAPLREAGWTHEQIEESCVGILPFFSWESDLDELDADTRTNTPTTVQDQEPKPNNHND